MKYSLRNHHNNKPNPVLSKSFELALGVIDFCEILDKDRKYSLSKQLFRSGTSIGANIREAQNAESKADFLHKMKIAAKESEETEYWFLLCLNSASYPDPSHLFDLLNEVMSMLNAIIASTKRNINSH